MRDLTDSSIGLGQWLGIPVRLHVVWLVVALFVMLVTTHGPGDGNFHYGLLTLAIWFACVVWHEAWHCVVVARVGETIESVVLTPLGGLSRWSAFRDPKSEIMAACAGCFGSLVGMLICASMIYALTYRIPWDLFNPLYPLALFADGDPWLAAANLGFWINWLLLLVNVMPTTATDGGRLLGGLMWAYRHQRQLADGLVVCCSLVVAGALLLFAFAVRHAPPSVVVPAWLPLTGLALFFALHAFFGVAQTPREEPEEETLGYDFSQGYTSLEEPAEPQAKSISASLKGWIEKRRQRRIIELERQAREEELRADVILARLHRDGISSLSVEDRELLNRVSARYRERIGK
ncbi:MAG: hypothetical protein DWQ31_10240 [Planctomycetota bacterium]|nr:MAG: hypothetical protein DWQ31_10240 [Planctomycetota bacterium]REJ96514.1 MAG: hypothetical protein DWQ35_03995 [Planctomycetota bacterium]REK21803.1 MAG: hypothetical protein DWQ42_19175 [Planctomycetota bacterium]REK43208.1 MAG: hypothetical protein DWQ46_12615 [Planctomycetota bacterium]